MACPSEYSWNQLLLTLTEMFAHDNIDADQVIKVMSAYKNDKRDWEQFSMFEEKRWSLISLSLLFLNCAFSKSYIYIYFKLVTMIV